MNKKQLNEQEKNEELVEIGITAYENKDYQKALAAKKIVHYLLLIVTPREKLPTAAIYKLIIKLR